MKSYFLKFGIVFLFLIPIGAWGQSTTLDALTQPYSVARGQFEKVKYRRVRHQNQFGQSYRSYEVKKVKYRRRPPLNVAFFADALGGTGFNPFLYQANTAGLQGGLNFYNQHWGFAMQAGSMYDHALPSASTAASQLGIPMRLRWQSHSYLRRAHYNPTTRKGGMIVLDGLATWQTSFHYEVGLGYFFFPNAKFSTARFGGWNHEVYSTGKKRQPQWVNLPNTLEFPRALGIELRMAEGFGATGLQPYNEIVAPGYSLQFHHVQYVDQDGWGFVEDIFGQRWLRHHITLGYTYLNRHIQFPNDEASGWTLQHQLDILWIDGSATLSFGPYYQPWELTVGGRLQFIDRSQSTGGSDNVTFQAVIPETPFRAYAKLRLLRNQIQ